MITFTNPFRGLRIQSLILGGVVFLSGCAAFNVDTQHGRDNPALNLKQASSGVCSKEEQEDRAELQQMLDHHVIALDERGHQISIRLKDAPPCEPLPPPSSAPMDVMMTALDQWIRKHQPETCKNQNAPGFNAEACNAQKPEVVFFIHGGLNGYDDTLLRIRQDARLMKKGPDGRERYPIFIAWPSGLVENYNDSLFNYDQGLWSDGLVTKLKDGKGNGLFDLYPNVFSPYNAATDALTLVARMPVNAVHTLGNMFGNHYATPEKLRENKLLDCRYGKPPWGPLVNEEAFRRYFPKAFACEEDDPMGMDNVISTSDAVFHGILTPVKMVALPFIDTVGRRSWSSMKARSLFAFRRPCPFLLADQEMWWDPSVCSPSPLMTFLDHLQTMKDKTQSRYVLRLIGHSMGTMVAGRIINHFPDLPYENVVFIGAAISVGDFLSQVQPVMVSRLRRQEEMFHFYNLSLHPYAEMRSTEESISPEGSLLEWIDTMYETPATMEDRTLGKWTNAVSVIPFMNQPLLASGYVHFKRFGLRKDSPLKHSEMVTSDRRYWEKSYWTVADELKVKDEAPPAPPR